ncbi:MAG: hypothetical protein JWR55_1909 [Aeromicrobium sp.]|nr:hypothetical protein [Aeromicrobium sp.]
MKKLTRSPDDKWIAGICGGLADYTGLDANLIRLVLAICTILGAGSLIIGYVVAWVLLPAPRRPQTAWAKATDRPATAYEP